MRLIVSFSDEDPAQIFSLFLRSKGIENDCQRESAEGCYKIWIYNEDETATAIEWLKKYKNDPTSSTFTKFKHEPKVKMPPINTQAPPKRISRPRRNSISSQGPITMILLLACIFLFVIPNSIETFSKNKSPLKHHLINSPVNRALLYDYPDSLQLLTQLLHVYGRDKLEDPETLSNEGRILLRKYSHMQFWHGFYPLILRNFQEPESSLKYDGPIFEKIRQGEVWRCFTPSLLHGDIFHIFFNMIWLLVLASPIEKRLGTLRFVIFILLTAILSNTAQYLMTGYDFLGISGVLSAMVGFIWMRQERAPWEGYQLHRSAIGFFAFFVIALLLLQIASFYLEINGNAPIGPGIANTAHIGGALVGIILGRTNLFSMQKPR